MSNRKTVVHQILQDALRVEQALGRFPLKEEYLRLGKYGEAITRYFGSWFSFQAATKREKRHEETFEPRVPKIIILDIETAPSLAYVWGLYDQNVGVNQIVKDRHLLSFAAIQLDAPPSEIIYRDLRGHKNVENDKPLLVELWSLLNDADVVVGQNSKQFDVKVINSRFAIHNLQPPSPYKQIDTRDMARKNFAFSSNKLEFLSDRLCPEHKKEKHKLFPGFELWLECLRDNPQAWNEMQKYNCQDVLATRELYKRLLPWGQQPGVNLNVYHGDTTYRCQCGSSDLIRRGYNHSRAGKFQRYSCNACGAWASTSGEQNNLLSLKKKMSLKNGP